MIIYLRHHKKLDGLIKTKNKNLEDFYKKKSSYLKSSRFILRIGAKNLFFSTKFLNGHQDEMLKKYTCTTS